MVIVVMSSREAILDRLAKAILNYDIEAAKAAAAEAVDARLDPLDAINNGLAVGMKQVGVLFESGDYCLPFVMLSSDAFVAAMDHLKAHFPAEKIPKPVGTFVIGVVSGDIHDIGSKIVAAVLSASGFKVYHIGRDVTIDKFIEEAEKVGADIIGASTLLTNTMPEQKILISELQKRGLRPK